MNPDDDDQRWLDLLAGRSVPDAPKHTQQEAAWMRAALLAYKPRPPAGQMPEPTARVQRLLQRAVAAGVLPATARPGWWSRLLGPGGHGTSAPLRWTGATAVLLLGLGIVFKLALPDAGMPEPAIERGSELQTLVVPDPQAERQRLLGELQRAGLTVTPYERLGRPGLDLELAVPLPPAQAADLVRLGLRPTGGPSLRVEFVAVDAAPAASQ